MKKFENAELEVHALEVEDIVTASNEDITGGGNSSEGGNTGGGGGY